MINLGVPYSALPKKLDIVNTREDEAVAMAAGIEMAGGEACVYMQDDGYLNTVNVIATLLHPYGITIFVRIHNRKELEHHKYANKLKDMLCYFVAGNLPSA